MHMNGLRLSCERANDEEIFVSLQDPRIDQPGVNKSSFPYISKQARKLDDRMVFKLIGHRPQHEKSDVGDSVADQLHLLARVHAEGAAGIGLDYYVALFVSVYRVDKRLDRADVRSGLVGPIIRQFQFDCLTDRRNR